MHEPEVRTALPHASYSLSFLNTSRDAAPERRTLRIAKTIDLPDDIETTTIDIPPIQNGTVNALQLFASGVPHVGVDNGAVHFLASYEAVARP